MNREILFRGFHEDKNGSTTIYVDGRAVKGEWVEGLPGYDINGQVSEIQHFDSPAICVLVDVIPSTVCQYTGLTDKNGFKIWDGDTMNVTDWAGHERQVSVIGFHNGVCWFGGDGFSDEYIFNTKSREVTGTIWDKEHKNES